VTPTAISRRKLPGGDLSLSSLSFELGTSAGGPSGERIRVGVLRRAREAGVTTFSMTAAPGAGAAERVLSLAFGDRPEPIEVVVPWSATEVDRREGPAAPSADSFEDRLRGSLERLRSALPASARVVLQWSPEDRARPIPEVGEVLESLRAETLLAAWAYRCPTPDSVTGLVGASGSAPAILSAPLSLLETSAILPLEAHSARRPVGVLATDPLAEGRLDGSRFSAAVGHRDPSAGPTSLRALHDEFDPVLRLGFLTEGHRRTLAQAAVRFVLAWPWVVTATVPSPPPERLDELVLAEASPAFSSDELERLTTLVGARPPVEEPRTA
jgi:aryl-alcohol dehydrogenase-like predicted oxidoreductase